MSCCCSATQLYPTLCDPMNSSIPSFSALHYLPDLPKLMSIELVMPSNHLILCHPLLLLPSIFLSIRVSSNEPVLCIRWPKYWSFSFSTSPSNKYSGLICFRIDWFDLAVQGIQESSPAPWFENIAAQLSHLYMTTGKTIALTIGTRRKEQ